MNLIHALYRKRRRYVGPENALDNALCSENNNNNYNNNRTSNYKTVNASTKTVRIEPSTTVQAA